MTKNLRLTGILITATLLLITPLIAMQFTDEVNWSVFDFIVAGVLLFGTGLLAEFIFRMVRQYELRLILVILIISALALVWLELAVGVFGTPFAGS